MPRARVRTSPVRCSSATIPAQDAPLALPEADDLIGDPSGYGVISVRRISTAVRPQPTLHSSKATCETPKTARGSGHGQDVAVRSKRIAVRCGAFESPVDGDLYQEGVFDSLDSDELVMQITSQKNNPLFDMAGPAGRSGRPRCLASDSGRSIPCKAAYPHGASPFGPQGGHFSRERKVTTDMRLTCFYNFASGRHSTSAGEV